MKLISGLGAYFRENSGRSQDAISGGDDHVLARKMRIAAVQLRAEGRARLRLSGRMLANFRQMIAEAEELRTSCVDGGPALERLTQDGRQMMACAEQARLECTDGLVAVERAPRIERVLEILCGDGDVALTKERLMLGIASFDDVQPLEMAELWATPEAIRICLTHAYLRASRKAMEIAGERRRVERWIDGAPEKLSQRTSAFFEYALQLAADREDTERYGQLERQIARSGNTVEQVVQSAHSQASIVKMRLENLMAGKRLMDSLDWQKCFEELSQVEQELRYDPSGIYPGMEEDSCAAVRREVAVMSRRLGLSELTVARHAVKAAQLAVEDGAPASEQTICYWLYSDAGRRSLARRMGAADAVLPKMVMDPSGRISVVGIGLLFLIIFGLYLSVVRNIWFVGMGIPLAWCAAMALLGRLFPKLVKPAKLLKLKIDHVPDELRTLVVMPVLLSSVERAREICDQFEALGCLEKDDNIRYLILGDFADADAQVCPEDGDIVEYVRKRILEMNRRAGREQYFYLHRERSLLQIDNRWMGRDRKRGALMDLNRLLLGEERAEEEFRAENGACNALKTGFRYVLTLDADTRFLPGAVQRMIGTLAHPLNAVREENGRRMGYAVLQPQMEMMASACVNGFVRLFAGNGGLNTYPSSVSSYWQDVTGTGLFGGKGLYDVKAFAEALEDSLPEGKILSHDLIEGTLAGTALASDICFYDGYPATLGSFLKRLNRWTRGDWQLLPILLGTKRYPPEGRRLSAAERLRMVDNLLRSLWAPSLLGLLTQAVWMNHGDALAVGVLLAYWTPLVNLFNRDRLKWRRATAEFSMLPAAAAANIDAIVRTLWRLSFTRKHLLDWVTSADAEKSKSNLVLANRISAILLIPGLFMPGGMAAALALGALFLAGPGWIRELEEDTREKHIDAEDAALLLDLARDTWLFFDRYVTAQRNFLPPDNVQIDPDVGAANRTSPTNIGLYLMSCLSAHKLAIIGAEDMKSRMEKTIDSLERMEKWKGHLYNWYDVERLQPLSPKYVSSVDSGNLAAGLLLCASAVREVSFSLSDRMEALAKAMDFRALYEVEKNLFRIGVDVEHDRLSESHYDLLASESRILSFAAMMLGCVPLKHWERLGRTAVGTRGGAALASWSGTMFEYLMPELFMHAPENTLIGQTMHAAICAQRAQGERRGRPWGISESGYGAFDLHLNYQYRAFGLRELALGGEAQENVVAPYASVMAVFDDSSATVRNVEAMSRMGWRGECGLYEAADYMHADSMDQPRLVKSHMAHHQGMALCAICNALTDRELNRAFHRIPEARSLELLLEERPLDAVRVKQRELFRAEAERPISARKESRTVKPERRLADTHLLGGAGATALVTADGAVHYQRDGMQASRFDGDLLNRTDGACVHIWLENANEEAVLRGRTVYTPGGASICCGIGKIQCEMEICISPEDGTLFKKIRISNQSEKAETVRVTDCVPVSMGTTADMLAHPVFRHLFVESERIAPCALMFKRRPRNAGETSMALLHMISSPGAIVCETDFERLVGRMGSTMRPGGINREFSNTVGTVLNPCSALRSSVVIEPGKTVEMHFALGMTRQEEAKNWIQRNFPESMPERAQRLSAMQAQAMQRFIGLQPQQANLLHRMAALLFDGHLRSVGMPRNAETTSCSREELWALGISGDHPVLLMHVKNKGQMRTVREAMRAHEFYRTLGVWVDLALINEHGNDYNQPTRDMINEAIAFSHLNELRGAPGGVHLLEGERLTAVQREALRRASALEVFDEDFDLAVRRALTALDTTVRETFEMRLEGNRLLPMKIQDANGFGGFLADGRYAIDVLPDRTTPAPWSNLMTNDQFGMLTTERGGGFLWYGNSRSGRLTTFANDVLSEGWGWMLYLVEEESGSYLRLLPGNRPSMPYRVIYSPVETIYRFETERLSAEVALCVRSDAPEMRIHVTVRSAVEGRYRLVGFVDWLMGTDARDAAFVRTWARDSACFAAGTMDGVGYFASANARVRVGCDRNQFIGRGGIQRPDGIADCDERSGGWVLYVPVELRADEPHRSDWAIGAAQSPQQAYARVRSLYARSDYSAVRTQLSNDWKRKMDQLVVETPDSAINRLANGWLQHQTLSSRIQGRTGLYQPGGAYGFRDQLQDMLAMLPSDPARVREHILRCAAHQFEDGDVMHWWHEPYLGVRTHISDDLLFLPYVTAQYVKWTEDESILQEKVCYLRNVEIEEGKEDRFCEMQPGSLKESLHEHCMRAFRKAAALGEHGLLLMGCGDWNDGMNRVGNHGRGESIWLTEFMSVCAQEYARNVPGEEDRAWLIAISDRLNAAIEETGWDGSWYLRAYTDEGIPLGSRQNEVCQIDAISQAWAVLAGLDPMRCKQAMESAWKHLADEEHGIIRLLTPPFDGKALDPGYIQGYPMGVRENGAQYTHAACWLLLALIREGNAERAHSALRMLLPVNHADTFEKAQHYRTEPYVVAADVYDGIHAGRGGWTWYTGSAAWLYLCILSMIGFEQRGKRVRVCALLGEWPEASVTVAFGAARYKLVSRRGIERISLDGSAVEGEWIEMIDDGREHEAIFPPRKEPLENDAVHRGISDLQQTACVL